jgi:hypothetical protein
MDLYAASIGLPKTQEEINHVTESYSTVGLPGCIGCIGSIDCVHVHWDSHQSGATTEYKGKEGFPSLVFEVIVSHM